MIKRFDFGTRYSGNTSAPDIVEKADGRYVLYSDYAALLSHNNLQDALLKKQAEELAEDDGRYFLQDTRSYIGNCPMWWAKDGKGYTTRLDEAHRYTLKEALSQYKCRDSDLPWLCSEIEALARPTVDMQCMRPITEQQAAMQQDPKP